MTFNLHNYDSYEIHLKVVILGDSSCGKTCFTSRYTQDDFTRQYFPTPGASFHLKPLTIQNRGVKLILWDIGGRANESCPALVRTYVSSANIAIFMYDITSSQSFASIPSWVDLFHLNRKGSTPTYVALVANKCDMEHQRVVTLERHAKLVQSLQLHAFPVSARTGDNVQCAFKFVCHQCAKDNEVVGFDDEEEFVKHSGWHVQQNQAAQDQLVEDAKRQQEADDLRPKLFHCHHCQFVQSFNSSSEFIAHIEKEHHPTTVEDCTMFVPQGKLKMKGHKDIPPELSNLNEAFNPGAGPGGFGGGGGGGGFGGGGGGFGGGGGGFGGGGGGGFGGMGGMGGGGGGGDYDER